MNTHSEKNPQRQTTPHSIQKFHGPTYFQNQTRFCLFTKLQIWGNFSRREHFRPLFVPVGVGGKTNYKLGK